jgi:hypothetical protein
MSEARDMVFGAIEENAPDRSAHTRGAFVKGTAGMLGVGTLAMMGLPASAFAANDPQTILNVAASAEVLATIVNTVGWEKGLGGDAVTQRNVKTAAREELRHFRVLQSLGGKQASWEVWVPDKVFASRTNLLNTLQVGDQIFINAYLIAVKAFGDAGKGATAAYAAEFMGVEAVHRALARQSLGLLGNDRAFMKFNQPEEAPGAPNQGQAGFTDVTQAVVQLRAAGFNFGAKGAAPGQFYNFNDVQSRTPTDSDINTYNPDAG